MRLLANWRVSTSASTFLKLQSWPEAIRVLLVDNGDHGSNASES